LELLRLWFATTYAAHAKTNASAEWHAAMLSLVVIALPTNANQIAKTQKQRQWKHN
jgi:hypothetical protein